MKVRRGTGADAVGGGGRGDERSGAAAAHAPGAAGRSAMTFVRLPLPDALRPCPGPVGGGGRRQVKRPRRGQALVEFALTYSAVILPLTFMTIFVAQALWIWHGMVEFTREGARYATTHFCGQTDGENVISYMQSRVPAIVDQAQFQAGGSATVQVQYNYAADLDPAACGGCIPDSVTVSVTGYTYGRLAGYLRLPGITMPTFTTNLPMESAGYDSTGTVVCQ